MTVMDLLAALRELGIQISVDNDQVRINAPKGALTPELRSTLSEHKTEILSFLREAQSAIGEHHLTITPADRTKPLPLSFAQQRLWFLQQFDLQDTAYNLPFALRISGPLHMAVLQQSLDELVRRHESLRTTFRSTRDMVQQIIAEPHPVSVLMLDLEALPTLEQEAQVQQLIAQEARQPFDLIQGPLIRGLVLRQSATKHVVALTLHHIISDGWSLGILARELGQVYAAFAAGTASSLPEMPIQYADYAVWQQQSVYGGALDKQMAYWQRQLAGAPPLLALPTDRPRPPKHTFAGVRYGQVLSPALSKSLAALAQAEEATLFMTLLAALQTLLARYTGQDDIVVGSAIADRNVVELEGVIGCFVNTLALRTDLSGNPSFRELLRRVRRVCLDAYAHQSIPFEKVVEVVQTERNLSYSPIFQVMLVLQNAATNTVALPGLKVEYLDTGAGAAKFDLSLEVVETVHGLHVTFEYNTVLFDALTIERLAEQYELLLTDVAAQPDQRVSDLRLLSAAMLGQLQAWNDTDAAIPSPRYIHELIEQQAQRSPDRIALVFEDQQLTYHALNERANQLALELRQLNVGLETRVAICLDRSLELVIGILGILKAGGAYVPLDPEYPPQRLQFILEDARAQVLLTEERYQARFSDQAVSVLCLDQSGSASASAVIAPPRLMRPANLAYLIYTSGSTGRPKGVMVSHDNVANFFVGMDQRIGADRPGVWLAVTSVAFDISVLELLWTLSRGFKVIVQRNQVDDAVAHQPAVQVDRDGAGGATSIPARRDYGIIAQIWSHGVTHLQCTPSLAKMLLAQPAALDALRSLDTLMLGGEALPPVLAGQILDILPGRLLNMYGPTETTIWSTVQEVAPEPVVPIGRPIANTTIYILDQHLQQMPIGVPGELYIGGAGVVRGYLARPATTAERFIPDPFSTQPGTRLYRTGDLARYRADGAIEYLGRLDFQVKLHGFRIELGEIETTLSQHPAVAEAVVVAQQPASGGDMRLVAYIVPSAAAASQNMDELTDVLTRALHEQLPPYMTPSNFMFLDALPLTPNGKLDRNALPAPDSSRLTHKVAFVAPQTAVQQTLVNIWKQVLGVEQISIHDNFFVLGGDSILSFQIIARASEAGLSLTPAQIFQYPTIARLANVVSVKAHVDAEQGLVHGPLPLTPIQHWFLSLEQPEPHYWNQSVLLDLAQPLDVPIMEQTLRRLVEHHDALRLRFTRDDHGWQQYNVQHDEQPLLTVIDLRGMTEREQTDALTTHAAVLQATLDLRNGPLLRVAYFDLDGRGKMLLAIHHLAVDGMSWNILLEDLHTTYQQLKDGAAWRLPAKTSAFKQWATRLQAYAQTSELRAEREFWLSRPWQQISRLPVDRSVDLVAHHEATRRIVSVTLSAAATSALLQEVPQSYSVQSLELILTALTEALRVWSDQRVLLLDLEGHGREDLFPDIDLSRTVGWFTTIFPVVLDMREAQGPEATIKAVKEQLRQIPRHGIGYGLLRYLCSDPTLHADMAALPQADVLFNYFGQFDQSMPEHALFTRSREEYAPEHSPRNRRTHILGINGFVANGCLQLDWYYSAQSHDHATIERTARACMDTLQTLITHCLTSETRGETPSDFPLAGVDQIQLDRIVAGRTITDLYPLSSMQQGMLFHTLSAAAPGVYVQQMSCGLYGALNSAAFGRAWQQVIQEHPILRTGFFWEHVPQLLQAVYARVTLPVTQLDWRAVPLDQHASQLAAYLQADREQGFDLVAPPLMRLTLIQTDDLSYRFVWSYHHIILDGWSMPAVLSQVLHVYDGLVTDQSVQIEPSRPYRDYIAWLQQQEVSAAEQFWRTVLKGFHTPTILPTGSSGRGTDGRDSQYGETRLTLSAEMTQALQALARRHQLTINTLLQGVWALLLHRYTGEQDVLFGGTVSGRPPELTGSDRMVGLFINTLPIRVQIAPDQTLIPWLQQIQAYQVETQQYEYTPLVQIHSWSQVPWNQALFESIFIFENYPVDAVLQHQRRSLQIELPRFIEQTNYPLTILAVQEPLLQFTISYDLRRFEDQAIQRMQQHLHTLLAAIVADSTQRLAALPLLSQAEQQMISAWNATSTAYPTDQCVHTLIQAQVTRTPTRIALVFDDVQLTYAELDTAASRLARQLTDRGVGPDVPVALYLERSPDLLIALLAVLKAGGCYIPLDPTYPAERVGFMLQDAQAPFVLTHTALQPRLHEAVADTPTQMLYVDQPIAETSAPFGPRRLPDPANLAYIIYTSGSTGRPKGVQISHGNVVAFLTAMQAQLALSADDVLLAITTISFDIAVLELLLPLTVGARVALVPDAARSDGQQLAQRLVQHDVTFMQATPATWRMLLASSWQGHPGLHMLCGGEALSPELAAALQGCGTALWNVYGPTETTVWSTTTSVLPDMPVTIGRPIANMRTYVLDDQLRPVPIGVVGDLYLAGACLARGYCRQPALTAERFVPEPFNQPAGAGSGARMYRTGDRARYLPDGQLEYLGRGDTQIKLRGYRIELGEIETVLAQHPAVGAGVVVLRGQDATALIAYVVPAPGATESAEQLPRTLRAHLLHYLPDYMVPSVYMLLEALPLTPNGKVDRRALPEPTGLRPAVETSYVAPQTELERDISAIWQEVLHVEKVGRHDNFFDLGGHSLLVIQVYSKLQTIIKRELPILDLFKYPTVSALAEYLSGESAAEVVAVEQPARDVQIKAGQSRLKQQLERRKRTGTKPPGVEQ